MHLKAPSEESQSMPGEILFEHKMLGSSLEMLFSGSVTQGNALFKSFSGSRRLRDVALISQTDDSSSAFVGSSSR